VRAKAVCSEGYSMRERNKEVNEIEKEMCKSKNKKAENWK
jgi:hypothetical protein